MPVRGVSLRLIDTTSGQEQPVRNSIRSLRSEWLTKDEIDEARIMADDDSLGDDILEEHLTSLEERVADRVAAGERPHHP